MNESGHALNGPHFVVTPTGDIHGEDTLENQDLVGRITACVNACEGLTTEELENGIIQDMRRVIAEIVPVLQSQNTNQQPARKKLVVHQDNA